MTSEPPAGTPTPGPTPGPTRPDIPRTREERRAERARIARLSRLPPLYSLAERGPGAALVATLLQVVLAVALVLVPARLLTGRWLPPFVALVVLAAAYALQALARYLNARAGRR